MKRSKKSMLRKMIERLSPGTNWDSMAALYNDVRYQGRRRIPVVGPVGKEAATSFFSAHEYATSPGPQFAEFDPEISYFGKKRAKVIAYYLPQFHAIEINDRQWGKGFTEWRQLARGIPRFVGHIQPRLPRDLGFYDLSEGDALRRQIEMAKAAGIDAFCFYHYSFSGKRVLEAPIERFLADPTLDFQFCLMWANENWTRTWDGMERDVILAQTYDGSTDEAMVDDLARQMKDSRYMRIDNRPLFFIYRPGQIPDAKGQIEIWRKLFADRHGLDPLFFMAQSFGDHDPSVFGLDGAIEFPPHKVCSGLPLVNHSLEMLDPNFAGQIFSYDAVVERSCNEQDVSFPLIRTVVPSWDNQARRPGRGLIIHGSSPQKFGAWVDRMIDYSVRNPVYGENIICVNAWNEWAEGAVLEPDVHFGAAYLNELSNAVHGVSPRALQNIVSQKTRVLLVGHDAGKYGAQILLLGIGKTLKSQFGIEVQFLLGAGGPMLDRYRELGPVHVASSQMTDVDTFCEGLGSNGWTLAITNTTPAGKFLPHLKKSGFRVVSLIHELPNLIKSFGLQDDVRLIGEGADHVIFPAEVVRQSFETLGGPLSQPTEIFPQGLYDTSTLSVAMGDNGVRAELGLSPQTRIVLGMGYADLRKGVDRFVAAGLLATTLESDVAFLWVGAPAREVLDWFQPEIDASGLGDRVRFLGFREDTARLYAAADAFYLSSREDPFPSVVLEAMACGLHVVGHRGAGGCDSLIAAHGTLLSEASPVAAVEALRFALRSKSPGVAAARRDHVAKSFDFDTYVFGLMQRLDPQLSAVSAVVPNYNYSPYIEERLRTVFNQTYALRDVVVLDDASPDGSVAEIERTGQVSNRSIDLHVNPANSGSVFRQWLKGVELAKGDYVWIAEADDLAHPAFVERLVDRMRRAGSVLGFADSRQIDKDGNLLQPSYLPYMNEIEARAFDRPFDMAGAEFLARFLSVKNVILNVSGVIFHRQTLLDAFASVGEELSGYSVAGDWRLYVEICAREGSRVTWLPEPMNTHRLHKVSVTHSLKAEAHLGEIARLQDLIGTRITLDEGALTAQATHLKDSRMHILQTMSEV